MRKLYEIPMAHLMFIGFALAVCDLAGCAVEPAIPQTVTITKTEPVYPPATLYSATSPCAHSAPRTDGTMLDLANALIDERAALAVCLGDRAALREWRAANEAK